MGFGAVMVWARRWVQNPVATLVFCAVLSLDGLADRVLDLDPNTYQWMAPKTARSFLGEYGDWQLPHRYTLLGAGMTDIIWFLREGDGFRLIDTSADSADEFARASQTHPELIVGIAYESVKILHGVWGLTHELEFSRLKLFFPVSPGQERLTPRELGQARGLFADYLKTRAERFIDYANDVRIGPGVREAAELVRLRDSAFERRLWAGYVHNTLALAALGLLIYSLAWIPRTPAWLVATRRRRALARGRCPHCGYSIVGLREPLCPECGKPWDVVADARARE